MTRKEAAEAAVTEALFTGWRFLGPDTPQQCAERIAGFTLQYVREVKLVSPNSPVGIMRRICKEHCVE
jgi:hypothetical protein